VRKLRFGGYRSEEGGRHQELVRGFLELCAKWRKGRFRESPNMIAKGRLELLDWLARRRGAVLSALRGVFLVCFEEGNYERPAFRFREEMHLKLSRTPRGRRKIRAWEALSSPQDPAEERVISSGRPEGERDSTQRGQELDFLRKKSVLDCFAGR